MAIIKSKNRKKLSTSQSGFTLIEVLIVISIIGMLSAAVLVGLSGFRARGRDVRRLGDLKSIQNGLELYYTKNNSYPTADKYPSGLSDVGVNKVPNDPINSGNYTYKYELCAGGAGYVIQATLNAVSSDVIYNDSASTPAGCSLDCDKGNNHFCVSF